MGRVCEGRGGNGQGQDLTSGSGVSDETSITSTSYTWTHGGVTSRAVSIHCDDMDSDDGRQTAGVPAWDELTFQFQGDGANAVSVRAISVWDAA